MHLLCTQKAYTRLNGLSATYFKLISMLKRLFQMQAFAIREDIILKKNFIFRALPE